MKAKFYDQSQRLLDRFGGRWVVLGLVLAVCLGILFQFQLPIMLAGIYLTYRLSRQLWPSGSFESVASYGFVSLFAYLFILQSTAVLFGGLSQSFHVGYATFVSIVLLLLFSLLVPSAKTAPKLRFITRVDIIALAVIGVGLAGLYAGPLLRSGGTPSWLVISSVSGNVDDLAHLSFVHDRLFNGTGLLARPYPAGWHSVNAIVIRSFDPHIQPGVQTLRAYVVTKIFGFVSLLYASVLFTNVVCRFIMKRSLSWTNEIIIGLGSSLGALFFITDIFRLGFYNVLPQLTGILLLILALLRFTAARTVQERQNSLLLAVIFCIGGALTWVLLLPPLALAIALTMLIPGKKLIGWRALVATCMSWPLLAGSAYLGLSVLIQVWALSSGPGAVSFVQTLILDGAIVTYSTAFYQVLLVGCIGFLYYAYRNGASINAIVWNLFTIFLFAAVVFMIQVTHAEAITYYFYKVLYAAIIIAIPVSVVALVALIDRCDLPNPALALAAVAIILIAIPTTIDQRFDAFRYLRGDRWLTQDSAQTLYRSIAATDYRHHPPTVLYDTPANGVGGDISMLLSNAADPDQSCFLAARDIINATPIDSSGNRDIVPTLTLIKQQCIGQVHIVTQPEMAGAMTAAIHHMGLDHQISVSTADLRLQHAL